MHLYITVETTSREMDAKTFLACAAAAEGFDVIIGLEDMVRRVAALKPAGIFYDKAMHTDYPPLFESMRKLGHRVAVNDEEGLVIDPEWYKKFGLPDHIENKVDLLLTWGEVHGEMVRDRCPALMDKSVPVGNVRMDLLRPELKPFHQPEVDALLTEHGPFVLINTRFGLINSPDGLEFVKQQIDNNEYGPREFMHKFLELDKVVFEEFQEMVATVCRRFPNKTFILRPHPSEDKEFWEKAAIQFDNLKVIRKGNVHTWLIASDMLIHTGCTTAVEALLCSKPCVSFSPIPNECTSNQLSEFVSYIAEDTDEVCNCIAGKRNDEFARLRPEWIQHTRKYIHSISGPLAAESTISQLKQLAARPTETDILHMLRTRPIGHVKSWNRRFRRLMRTMKGKPVHRPDAKWTPLTLEQFKTLARRFSFYDQRFANIEITNAYPDCFRLNIPERKSK